MHELSIGLWYEPWSCAAHNDDDDNMCTSPAVAMGTGTYLHKQVRCGKDPSYLNACIRSCHRNWNRKILEEKVDECDVGKYGFSTTPNPLCMWLLLKWEKMSVMSQLDTSFAHLFHSYLFFQHLIYCFMFTFLIFGTLSRTTKSHQRFLPSQPPWNSYSQTWLQNQTQAFPPSRLPLDLYTYITFNNCIFSSYLHALITSKIFSRIK